jgi:hypothetical protein
VRPHDPFDSDPWRNPDLGGILLCYREAILGKPKVNVYPIIRVLRGNREEVERVVRPRTIRGDSIHSPISTEGIGVVACSTVQGVVAWPADEQVVAQLSSQDVAALQAIQIIGVDGSVQRVISRSSIASGSGRAVYVHRKSGSTSHHQHCSQSNKQEYYLAPHLLPLLEPG